MTRQINWFWLLPVATGVLGALAAFGLYQPPVASSTPPRAAAESTVSTRAAAPVTNASLDGPELLEQVTLPPAPAANVAVARQIPQLTPVETDEQLVIDHRRPAERPQSARDPQDDIEDLVASGEVSADLAARFNAAMTATDAYQRQRESGDADRGPHPVHLTELPEWYQQLVPPLSFSSHIYSTDDDNRWVKVNGQVVREGELIDSNLRLVAIHPQEVVIEMQNRRFTLPALTDW